MAKWSNALAVDAAESAIIVLGRLQRYSRRHPRRIAAAIFSCFAAMLLVPWLLSGATDALADYGVMSLDQMVVGVMWQTMLCLILMGLVAILRWQDIVGFLGPIDRGGLISFYCVLFVPAAILLFLMFGLMGDGTTASPLRVIMIILSLNAMVGMSEELLFRGFIFGALRQKHRLITAIVVSSLVFGLIHIANLGAGQSAAATTYQIFNAMLLGALFCAILLQTNSLWPPILLHMIWNSYVMLGFYSAEQNDPFVGMDTTDPIGISIEILVLPSVLLCITVLILWRYQKRTGIDLFKTYPTPPS